MTKQDEEQRLGVLHLEKTHRHKRNPKKFKKTNFTRSALTDEDKKALNYTVAGIVYGTSPLLPECFMLSHFRYAQVEPLYQMWCEYYRSLLGDQQKAPDERMLKADYHGALVLVAEAHNPTMVGIVGIILLETRQTFQLITKEDKYVVIPKQGTALQFILDGRVFTLFGDAMRYKPSLRGKKHRLRVALPFFIR
ncbi:unnamed protein product [Strongylus vulgaris]|uniref:Ribonuclease P protein subunit p29 n=1 Tax=Strongylus vulgaris TaxID=40348 RepID=A0A3P7KG80_STRVU|nr:unnamed protein product [Strongylus vulgaris]